jgi:phosphate transport system ATP-binding protein
VSSGPDHPGLALEIAASADKTMQAGEKESAFRQTATAHLHAENVNLHYGRFCALRDVSLEIPARSITALIGPSGCGKSSFLRLFNRMNDLIAGVRVEGRVLMDGVDLYSPEVDVVSLRRHVGMVFQKPNPFPMSTFDNVAFGPRRQGITNRSRLKEIVERSLHEAALWDEVQDKLNDPGTALSGGQQQRLCIARVLAVQPQVILLDEPCSALDPVGTLRIEDLMRELAANYTILIVTHNMQQAARVSSQTAFMLADEERAGRIIEFGLTEEIFTKPKDKRTEDYITGRFG